MPDFGNPYAHPIGYFLTSSVVSTAGKHSKYGKYNWLKDIQSVYPSEQIPYWVLSNYFYQEMSPLLRWLLLPFLLFYGLEFFVLGKRPCSNGSASLIQISFSTTGSLVLWASSATWSR